MPCTTSTPRQDLPSLAHYRDTPVDTTHLPEELTGVRTIFEGLHHVPPERARALLADAATRGVSFAAFELTQRSLPYLPGQLPPLRTLVCTAGVQDVSVKRTLDGFESTFG